MKLKWIVIAGVSLIVALFLLLIVLLSGFDLSSGMSEINERVDVVSPDGRYIATGYHVWGGATVDNATVVKMQQSGWFAPEAECVLSVDMTKAGDNPFTITWTDDSHLNVHYTAGRVYTKNTSWKHVLIDYVEQ